MSLLSVTPVAIQQQQSLIAWSSAETAGQVAWSSPSETAGSIASSSCGSSSSSGGSSFNAIG